MNIRRIFSQIALVIGTLLFSVGIQAFAAFTQPTTAPPNADAYAPLNTGPDAQAKTGGLLLNTGGAANGLIVQNGNVGIGTTVPGAKLEVYGSTETSGETGTLMLRSSGNTAKKMTLGWSDTADAGFIAPVYSGVTWKNLLLAPHGGNVGIGTTVPNGKLEVGNGNIIISGLATVEQGLAFFRSGIYYGGLFYTTDVLGGGVGLKTAVDAPLRFQTNNTDRLWITGAGNVGIGTETPVGKLDVHYLNRQFILQNDGNAVIYSTVSGAALWASNTMSSIRWKENIHPVGNALNKVLKLNGVYFDWKEGYTNPFTGGKKSLGFIAEEVGKVFPEIVSYDKDGSGNAAAIDYDKLTAVLVEAVKEQQLQIEALQREVAQLKNE